VALQPVSRSARTRCAVVAAALLGCLLPVAGPQIACAGEAPRAVLVVDTGSSAHRYCVALPDDSVTGIELVELAGDQHGLAYKLGFGGGAVCMLAGVGPTGGDCFEDYPDFWGYWRSDGSGGWSWGSTGAGSTTVGDGDVEGWAWGSGDGPDSHPAPPSTPFGSVCEPAPAPDPEPKPDSTTEPNPPRAAAAPPAAPGGPADTGAREPGKGAAKERVKKEKEGSPERRDLVASTGPYPREVTAPPTPTPGAAGGVDPASAAGPPAAGIAGIVAALTVGGAGALLARRRMRNGEQ
jgi:hypothetical protein